MENYCHMKKRTIAEESFNKRREELLQDIQKPPHLYFGDQIEVEIENIARPERVSLLARVGKKVSRVYEFSGFSRLGLKKVFFYENILVQDNLSFLETIPTEGDQENNLFDDHEKFS